MALCEPKKSLDSELYKPSNEYAKPVTKPSATHSICSAYFARTQIGQLIAVKVQDGQDPLIDGSTVS